MICPSCKGDGEIDVELPCPACLGTGLFKTEEEILEHKIKEIKQQIEINLSAVNKLKIRLVGLKKALKLIKSS